MSGSVEAAKDAEKVVAKVVAKEAEPAKTAPEAPKEAAAAAKAPRKTFQNPLAGFRPDARMAAVATVALVLGTAFGMVAAPRERTGEALGRFDAALEGSRAETARLGGEIERLMVALAAIRDSGETARSDAKALGTSVGDRLTRLEQGLDRKIAALTEKLAPTTGEQAAAAMPEKRTVATTPVAATTPAAVTQATPRNEPTQTASLAEPKTEAKPKTEGVENWALREVYDGIAMLEDRKRRLIEVVPGDSVPGIGRVEAIERRGRNWVVVTRQGVITPQTW